MGNEKELEEQLKNSNASLEKAVNVIKDLKDKLENSPSNENQKQIDDLEKLLAEKNDKIVELAESVAKTQPPPRRVKSKVKYSNKYNKTQIKASEKKGISTEKLYNEPEKFTGEP